MVCIIYGAKDDPKEMDGQAPHPRDDGCGKVAETGRETGLYRICGQEMDHRGTNTKTQDAGPSDGVYGGGGHPKRLGSRQRSGHHKTREPINAGKRGFTGMLWPKERIETLIALHQEGYSGSMVAEKMGMTRGQVLGKAFRLGLSFARELTFSKPRAAPIRKPKPIQSSPALSYIQVASMVTQRRLKIEKAMKEDNAANLVRGNKSFDTKPGNVKITGLTSDQGIPSNCRAIVDGEGVDAIYCGQPAHKRSYCEDHFKRFYYRSTSQPIPRY